VQYLIILFFFAFVTGFIGRSKGSSFFLWFVIGALLPVFGLVAAILSRSERDDPKRECPNCGNIVGIATQVCPRCGEDMDYPEEFVAPRGYSFVEQEPENEDQKLNSGA
jgi:ribosomal protein S27AE